MTDNLRQSATDKAGSALKPDSEKSTVELAQDKAKSAADSVASTLQPEGEKSATQKATDTVSGSGSEGNTYLEQAQEALGNAAQQAQETLGHVVEQAKEALGYGEQPPST
ncbi:heat shock protein 9/12-domain-containing protein [Neohortaea acidophila]|uniref:Heat shock protein 9/12-domain-containing protein n=1 Tax=Neohortaea acidophila TaxID=245834 RepID=A0A6A6PII5_9PEZI|nr:heat shock protein 9/12-domain-containing protein [Neohortaea acidophila]KAF2479343.1 heat shock protein 9/12-domain-containing protein [Neohortaea acidophila]